jgi:hypothetical protein
MKCIELYRKIVTVISLIKRRNLRNGPLVRLKHYPAGDKALLGVYSVYGRVDPEIKVWWLLFGKNSEAPGLSQHRMVYSVEEKKRINTSCETKSVATINLKCVGPPAR